MKLSNVSPKAEPAAWIGLAATVIVFVLDRFFHLSDGQWQQLVDAGPLVAGVLTRFKVSPARDAVDLVTEALAQAQAEQDTAAQRLADLRAVLAPVAAASPAVAALPVEAAPVAASPAVAALPVEAAPVEATQVDAAPPVDVAVTPTP